MKKKIVINIIIISIITAITILVGARIYQEKETEEEINKAKEKASLNIEITETKTEEKEYPKAQLIKQYKGFAVCAQIEIPKIELKTYILKNYSVKALKTLPTKFWGANPNETGNFCIAGHNFNNKNMFKDLKNLNINDKIIISDNNIGRVEYEIFNIDTVLPNNTDCLSQETEGKREITLITCTSDSKKRIIIKAREIE